MNHNKPPLRKIFTTSSKDLESANGTWIIGDKMPRDRFPELNSEETLVKYSSHEPPEEKKGEPDATNKSTLVVLVSGEIEHTFYESDKKTKIKETILKEEGDMVFYGPQVFHKWKVTGPGTRIVTIQFHTS
jgi:hypothetical protein